LTPEDAVRVSVVVPARNAAATIGRTLASLAVQDLDGRFEVIVVDDGSDDDTLAIARNAPGPVTVIATGGSSAADARNRGVEQASAPVIAFTDADCFPARDWLAKAVEALDGADLVQGRVMPDPDATLGPFDRTIWVESERGFYETANLIVRRDLFERVGGFEDWLDTGGEKLLAEDVWFGWRAVRAGARTGFAPEAVVHHAIFPRGPAGYVSERLRLRYFPAIAQRIPEFRRRTLFAGVFLSPRSAAFDMALAGAAVAALRRSALPLVAALPYARMAVRGTLAYRRRAPLVAAVRTAADAVGLGALVAGSLRWRSPVI
jgi:glycosyltransferase involved in cell wall biosynthesis